MNKEVVADAEATVSAAIQDLLNAKDEQAVIGVAPAGAGKSYAIGTAVLAVRKQKLRVAVATPTNEQAFALVSNLADRLKGKDRVTFVPASAVTLPNENARPNIDTREVKHAGNDSIVVGTLKKLGFAVAQGKLPAFDVLLIDEAYQANAYQYYSIADLAPRHLLLGDSGQLAPFSTAPEGDRWRGLDEDPLLTAVEILQRNHPSTRTHKLPITRRLDPRALPVARAFYPGHEFSSAVNPGVRTMTLRAATGKKGARLQDRAIEHASLHGWAHLELPAAAVVSADEETIELIVALARRLLERGPQIRCENRKTPVALREADIAVAVSHNDQKNALRARLDEEGLAEVVVNTANKLQGLTFEVVIAWHPLAGLLDADSFHIDPGRLCVMLTRHRHACFVVGRAGDRELVEGIPPATPSYVGWDSNPSLDGWYVHEGVFRALEEHRMSAG
ncbi:MAG: AAA family ATPase [Polyangiaceae bacterium]